jgi:small subunit ribosomal protein S17e
MGRVKTKNIKRIGEKLLEQYPEEFGDTFAENKPKVDKFTTVQSKPLRNKIAGYIVALKKKVVD